MNYLQTRLCELKKSLGSCLRISKRTILTFVVVSILVYTVYSQPDISDDSLSRRGVCDSWRRLQFKLVYSLQV